MQSQPGDRDDESDGRRHESRSPENALPRQQGDRGDDQRNFQEAFAEIEAVGAPALNIHLFFEFAGFSLDLLLPAGEGADCILVFAFQRFGFSGP